MAFDSKTRNRLARFVANARELIAEEFTQKFQSLYGLSSSGEITALADLKHLDEAQHATAERLRARLRHLEPEARDPDRVKPDTIEHLVREQAFTVLNRLAAIRMAEKRDIIVESVGRGYESKGFKVYLQVAGIALGDTYRKYRRYLLCLFDELAVDLAALFDLRSPAGLLFLREPALLQLLQLLNAPDLEPLWAEDETIGWIYQYYIDPAERKKMREKSSAPRNSRELAVRNQFFTPRYVVEFLTDNTLGRIWFEMTKGQTRLKDQCRYLVRRPNEIFLLDGETAPEPANSADVNLSQEELLRQPVHIPHRHLKDPRSIRMLDPACGSMHFGLYSFDLLEVIYDEAWEIAHRSDDTLKSPEAFAPFIAFVAQYPGKTAFLREVPHLIIEHNIHGIDIDPRCAQIAGLSLWLRAQRTWQQQRLQLTDRPRIRRSNIVCAEPMPGEEEFLNEFIEAQLSGTPEKNLLGQLVRRVFEAMKLAGEAGSLLKIEEEIAGAVAEAKQKWLAGPKLEQGRLFADDSAPPAQKELGLDVTGINDDTFWERAEERIYAALQAYAEQADHGDGYQRRLFADDAARGFAFIDLCRKRYDVVLMNPPFGEASKGAKDYISSTFKRTKNDLYAVFIERFLASLTENGALGAITSRSGFFLGSFDRWREELLLNEVQPLVLADLGEGVLDSAMVETAAYCLHRHTSGQSVFLRLIGHIDKDAALIQGINAVLSGACHHEFVFLVNPASFRQVPGAPFAYWVPGPILTLFRQLPALENDKRRVGLGLSTKNDFRFVRTHWEVRPEWIGRSRRWSHYANGSNAVPFYWDHSTIVLSEREFAELSAYLLVKFPYLNGNASWILHDENDYQSPVIGWPLRSLRFSPQAIPPGFVFSARTYALISQDIEELKALLAFLSSKLVHYLLSLKLGASGRPEYVTATVRELPIPRLTSAQLTTLRSYASALFKYYQTIAATDETSKVFVSCSLLPTESDSAKQLTELHDQVEEAVFEIYGIRSAQREIIIAQSGALRFNLGADAEEEGDDESLNENSISRFRYLLVYLVGCVFGRWDIRYATGQRPAPELPDPFAPLPVCSPGQLQNEQGLPLTRDDVRRLQAVGDWPYPLDLPWDGILLDDPGHPLDLEIRIHQVLQVIWNDHWEAIEREACEILGVNALRDYFRKPAGFFADHLKRYSKSRRQAPIFWPLSTASSSYTLWVYYHRLTDQTLHTALADFVEPKIKNVEREAQRQKDEGRTQKYGESIEFLDELKELRAEIERIIKLPWKPDLNDGVLITASPLWKLFRHGKWQKDLKTCWEQLEGGNYDWAHLAFSIWPNRVREKCKTDRSLAIAHGLEELCTVEPPKSKKGKERRKITKEEGKEPLHYVD
jgi:hypothetical protein